uniref:Uncharacterized protein n=1 Tax=Rhodopseudomonas palustris (strain BisA53) TaxID=316055 RepID=Q07PQ7_RHOP5
MRNRSGRNDLPGAAAPRRRPAQFCREAAPAWNFNDHSEFPVMVELLPSDPHENSNRAGAHPSRRLLVVALASLLVLGGAAIWRVSGNRPPEQAKAVAPPRDPMLVKLVENTEALEASQQQAIDQLQVLQDLVRAQQAETKLTSDRVAALNARLDTLQQSFASIAPPLLAEEAEPETSEPQARGRPPTRAKASARSPRAKKNRNARRR